MEAYIGKSWKDLYDKIKELEAENARLRQQRDSANAQLDFILQNTGADCEVERDI